MIPAKLVIGPFGLLDLEPGGPTYSQGYADYIFWSIHKE